MIPFVGQTVLYFSRPGVPRRSVTPAIVLGLGDGNQVDLLILYGAIESVERKSVPRKDDQNQFDAWDFTSHDLRHYQSDELNQLRSRLSSLERALEGVVDHAEWCR